MGTITKALELLDFFSKSRAEIGLGDFVKLTGRDKATVHRHLVELMQNGWLEQDPTTRAYRLGPAILRLSAVREATYPTRALIRPVVHRLSEDVGELVHASLLQGDQLSPIYFADPRRHGVQVHFNLSELLPLHATSSGLAVLAFSSDDLRTRILNGAMTAYTDQTVTDPDTLRALIDETRRTGLASSANAFDPEVASQGTAIFGSGDRPVGALSVSVPSVRATPDHLATIRGPLIQAARDITRSLGGTYPPEHPLSRP
ncbi:IclR family transcriptional regulator [Maritimibacter sp. UBA3975]|uniref:IclR family transcriptional regulator n=1 Tax=Maritimibacter sp. UBA3975 TaxID=1946833 RepID=UPI0025C3F5B1|nr:IclR family transcriptional regulator [Maritimibacter sp. UBA3975]|tara:strand:- start:6327 stop:7103 length:777 start_codon:yes stop_codon:yes gene_type:complete